MNWFKSYETHFRKEQQMSLLDITSSLPAILVGAHHAAFTRPGPSCSKVDSATHQINLFSVDSANWFT